ncbi:hypothetical protein Tco_0637710, partial [Tanacetum coccineum]
MTNPDQPSAPPTLTLVEKLYAVHNINTLVPEKLDLAESNYSTWSYFLDIPFSSDENIINMAITFEDLKPMSGCLNTATIRTVLSLAIARHCQFNCGIQKLFCMDRDSLYGLNRPRPWSLSGFFDRFASAHHCFPSAEFSILTWAEEFLSGVADSWLYIFDLTTPDISYAIQLQVGLFNADPREPQSSSLKRSLRYVPGYIDFCLQLLFDYDIPLYLPNDSLLFLALVEMQSIGCCQCSIRDLLVRNLLRELPHHSSTMANALEAAKLHDGYVVYPWQKKMQELLPVPNPSCFLSIIFLPKASEKIAYRYNDLEDTLSRANAWYTASQASGVPIVFISGETASSTVNAGSLSDLMNLANVSLYGFEDYHGVDISVVGLLLLEERSRLRSKSKTGFIHGTSVIEDNEDSPSARSGLSSLYREAKRARKLLIISRIGNQKVLPWMVSPEGAKQCSRCYDTVSLSQKLSLHRHAKAPISLLHLFVDQEVAMLGNANLRTQIHPPVALSLPPQTQT